MSLAPVLPEGTLMRRSTLPLGPERSSQVAGTLPERAADHDKASSPAHHGAAPHPKPRPARLSLQETRRIYTLERQAPAGVRRALDLVMAAAMLLLLLPMILVVCAALAIEFRGSPIYVHWRVGLGGRPFPCLKLRTMRDPEEDLSPSYDPSFKHGNATRVTRLGRTLRRVSIDEIPQLFNVLLGQMSIVGPRPIVSEELDHHYGRLAPLLLSVKPGLTGLWQVTGRSNLAYPERSFVELKYATTASIWKDICIILRTPAAIISGRGAF